MEGGMNSRKNLVILCVLVAALVGCGKPSTGETTPGAPLRAGLSEGVPREEAGMPPHYYVFDGGHGKYGYPQPIDEEDARQGRLSAALLMVRYMGEHDGVHVFQVDADENFSEVTRMECTTPCDSVKEDRISDGRIVHSRTTPMVEGTGVAAMFGDAGNGVLKAYSATGDRGSAKREPAAVAGRNGDTGDQNDPDN
jgi:hypothetical protein